MKIDDLRENLGQFWGSVSEGWDRMRHSAAGALTRFRPGEQTQLPERHEIDDPLHFPAQSWTMLGGDVFEDEQRLVVRLEAPGMRKEDFSIEVRDAALQVRGEKRFERESTEGRWRVLQCAYGSFQRTVPLPTAVRGEEARASYRDGVLRIDLPKIEPGRPASVNIRVD
ncbi:MAG: Hsp20/alpha crystallin family protein [Sphaerotilus natans subsp. sulfidivorans]|uniref:Hsp20/alpha crystallin family protein n=1 Tax=Sphaerotilus sulfidivorans TaxID=639200 RepID=UPI002354D9B3|nr:Hsp20/alpha crystallin family protein [Sphaerotilus sulfidivorans]MCK6403962.1 Hsp20/alpha crystallin family protein [Sphaerotilus sulfidivorans]